MLGPIGRELLDAAVTPVGYVDVACAVDGYSPRLVELPRSIAQSSPTGKGPSVAREVLDPVIHAVYNGPDRKLLTLGVGHVHLRTRL